MSDARVWIPLAAFVGVLALVGGQLARPADRTVRSALVGHPLPAFTLPAIAPGKPGLASSTFHDGRPRLLNVFASWCIPCESEAPQLMQLRRSGVDVEGIAVRDSAGALAGFLQRNGDPYAAIGDDRTMAVQLAIGSSGVPESYVIGGDGTIRFQQVGPIRDEDVPAILHALAAAR